MASGFAHVENHLRRTQNVAGIAEGDRHSVDDREGAIVIDGNELAHGLGGVLGRIERFDRRLTFLGPFFGNVFGVRALNFGRVLEHDRGEIARRERGADISGVAMAAEVGQVAAMINVRMAEDHRVE